MTTQITPFIWTWTVGTFNLHFKSKRPSSDTFHIARYLQLYYRKIIACLFLWGIAQIIARCVATWEIAEMCLCKLKYQGALKTHTPLIRGVEVPLIGGVGLSKAPCFILFVEPHPLTTPLIKGVWVIRGGVLHHFGGVPTSLKTIERYGVSQG